MNDGEGVHVTRQFSVLIKIKVLSSYYVNGIRFYRCMCCVGTGPWPLPITVFDASTISADLTMMMLLIAVKLVLNKLLTLSLLLSRLSDHSYS